MAVPKRHSFQGPPRQAPQQRLEAGGPTLVKCSNCGSFKLPHQACGNCGYYKGEEVIKKG